MRLGSFDHSGRFVISHRRLLWRIARHELKARYAGSLLGVAWAVLTPLVLLGAYAAVYLVIFQIKVPGLTQTQYVLLIFSGLVPFLVTSEALVAGIASVVISKSALSSTVFPIDLVPAKAVLLSQVTMMVGLAAISVSLIATMQLSWTVLFVPIVWALHLLALMGLTWILSLVNLVVRDLQTVMGLALMGLMIMSPIAYTPEMVPPGLKVLVLLNPFAYFVTAFQRLLVLGQLPAVWEILVLVTISVGTFVVGGFFFARAKRVMLDYV
jgi:lipopolysaccharide transport system permease protein